MKFSKKKKKCCSISPYLLFHIIQKNSKIILAIEKKRHYSNLNYVAKSKLKLKEDFFFAFTTATSELP